MPSLEARESEKQRGMDSALRNSGFFQSMAGARKLVVVPIGNAALDLLPDGQASKPAVGQQRRVDVTYPSD